MARVLTQEEIEALRAAEPYIPAPTERYQVFVDAGRTELLPDALEGLERGSVLLLDRSIGDPVLIVANAVTIAEGDLITVGGRAAVRVTSVSRSGRAQTKARR